jgi:hypothetical protein
MPTPSITIDGNTLPLRAHISPKGNESFVLAPKTMSTGAGFRGFRYGRTSKAPLRAVRFEGDVGLDVPLGPGTTESGNPKVSGTATVVIGGEAKTLHVQLSDVDADNWWVIVKAIPKPGAGNKATFGASDF